MKAFTCQLVSTCSMFSTVAVCPHMHLCLFVGLYVLKCVFVSDVMSEGATLLTARAPLLQKYNQNDLN